MRPDARRIPLNQQFFDWLAREIPQVERGAIHLEIEQGRITAIACHGHRFLYSEQDLGDADRRRSTHADERGASDAADRT